MKFFSDIMKALTPADPGLYVSRPVLNGADWEAWAKKWKIPNPTPAAEMHVTVLYSTVEVKMIPMENVYSIASSQCCFAMFGPENDCLVAAFDDWGLWSRNYDFQSAGAVSTWPTFRPHLTISSDAAGFDLTQEMMADAPSLINLGGEVYAPLKVKDDPDPSDQVTDTDDEEEDDDDQLVIVIQLAATEAKKFLAGNLSNPEVTPIDRMALRDISAQKSITKSVARRIAKTSWAPDAIKALSPAGKARQAALGAQPIKKSAEMSITVRQVSDELAKKLGPIAKSASIDAEKRIVTGIASVSTVDGVEIEDYEGDFITTDALSEFTHDLMRNQRAGAFEHADETPNEILEAMVFDKDLQDALGIDLGMEFLLTRTYVPNDSDWAEVKNGTWMQSIRGTMYYEDVPDA